MDLEHILPAINAGLNSLSAVLLVLGFVAIRSRDKERHMRLMMSALTVSALFLVCYLIRVALTGTHKFPGEGLAKAVYLAVLFSHMALAAVVPVLALRVIYLARKGRFAEHRRLARWTWPIWMYVSVTGVLVYLMLYHYPR